MNSNWLSTDRNISVPPPPSAGDTHPHHNGSVHHLAFYWGKNAEFIISGWPGNSWGMYALSLIFVFVLAAVVELLTHFNMNSNPGASRVASGFFQSGMYGVRVGLGYMVMLAVLSYNWGVFLAAVMGHTVAFAIFKCVVFNKEPGFK